MGRRSSPPRTARTWNGWRWMIMLLGLGCLAAFLWMGFHWAPGRSRWMLLFPAGFGTVLCAFALLASDEAVQRFGETDGGEY